MATPNAHKYAWGNPGHADYQCWRILNVVTDGPVRFGYAVVAGNPGQVLPAMNKFNPQPVWPATASDNPWYVIQAAGDRDANSKFAYFAGSSFTGEILRQDEFE
jgi:type IV pilus assembly protein PilA